ncbi:MAG: hypothetical protein AAGC91_12300 [Pseudomonadota bacterium]
MVVEADSGANKLLQSDWRQRFLKQHVLPDQYLATAAQFFDPLANTLGYRAREANGTLYVAINGCQGSGKSTLAAYLVAWLRHEHELAALALSLDDFYLTRSERELLAQRHHPLFATRGVPGTHDVDLLIQTLRSLSQDKTLEVPRFNKADDDRAPESDWDRIAGPLDVVILEGWCLGARGDTDSELREPINDLERLEDADGDWRRFSDTALRTDYVKLYSLFHFWIMLKAPGFGEVLRWRTEQEDKLRAAVGNSGSAIMNDRELRRFIAHYERHTRQCLRDLPAVVDVLLTLDSDRRIVDCRRRPGPAVA